MTAAAPWPFGPDTALDRSRYLARAAIELLERHNPAAAQDFRAMADHFGDGYWLNVAELPDSAPGDLLTRDMVATRARVAPQAVTQWSTRGLNFGGTRVKLTRYDGGYLPQEVDEFLKARDEALAARTRTSPAPRRVTPPVRTDRLALTD
jgi:hypothetical protein